MINPVQPPVSPVADVQAVAPGSKIIQQGIENLKAQNAQANNELTDILSNMRSQLGVSFGKFPQPQLQPQGPPDDIHRQRIALRGSQWVSEVIMAAVLDEEFKENVGAAARGILVKEGMYPDDAGPGDGSEAV